MSYDTRYAERPYNGPAARAPRDARGGQYPPRQPQPQQPQPQPQAQPQPPHPPQQQQPPPQQPPYHAQQPQYDQYQDDYAYGAYDQQYDNGYAQDYGPPPQNMDYGRGGRPPNPGYPPRDMYRGPPGPPRGGHMPPPRGRGGPMRPGPGPGHGPGHGPAGPGYPPGPGYGPGPGQGPRPGPGYRGAGLRGGPVPPGPGRGYPPMGRGGRPGPPDRNHLADPNVLRPGPMMNHMNSHEPEPSGPIAPYPGHDQNQQAETDRGNQIVDRMAALDMNGRPHPNRGPGSGPVQTSSMDDYGQPHHNRGPGSGPVQTSSIDDYGQPHHNRGPGSGPVQTSSMDDYGQPHPNRGPGSGPAQASSMDDYGQPHPSRGAGPGPVQTSSMDDYGQPHPSRGAGPGPVQTSSMDEYGQPHPSRGAGPGPVQASSMDEYGQPHPSRGPTSGPAQASSMDDYGHPPMDDGPDFAPQEYPDQRNGPPPSQAEGYDYQHHDYSQAMSPERHDFAPPARSMTMPVSHEYPIRNAMPPTRLGGIHEGPQGSQMHPPARPATSQSNRPPPHRIYPDEAPPLPSNNHTLQSPSSWTEEPEQGPIGDTYNSHYDRSATVDSYQPSQPRERRPTFDSGPRSAFEPQTRAPLARMGVPQPGPARFPEMTRTKSQPNLREPQCAIFEMANDQPPLPSGPPAPSGGYQAYQPPVPNETITTRPPPQSTLPSASSATRPPPQPAQVSPPGSRPGSGHPTPVRPGLMPNSIVNNMNDKPTPVRNYNGGTPTAASGAQGRPSPTPQNATQNAPMSAKISAAAEKAPVTVEELERLRATIKNDPNDQKSALNLAKKLIEAADVLVPRLPDPKARARSRERYIMDSHKILKKLTAAQNPDAMFFLADCFGRGTLGHEPDPREAFSLYQSAAKMGHPAAAYRTAVCCELGNDDGGGTRKDPLKAIQWYKRAATLGDTPAMYKVGMILLKGLLGQQKNPREAIGWLKRAAERADAENPHALHELGLLYESAQSNDVIIRDEAYALQLFEQAAHLGYKFSQFRLGCVYEYGSMGCPIDPRLSIMWYSRAATQEEHQSELALSGWYLTGSDGVLQQSDVEAYLWARKAAQAGLAKAEYAMGYFTEVGIGVPANLEDAKRWYWRAAAQDFPKARERLEELKRFGRNAPRQRERITRSKTGGKQQEGECSVM